MVVPEKSQPNHDSTLRVKVYCLSEDGKCDDRGTGHVTMDNIEESKELCIHVIDEIDNEELLSHCISIKDIYKKEEDTVISWRGLEQSIKFSLSFHETAGCNYVWDHISKVQKFLSLNSLESETFHNVNSKLKELPDVKLSTLPQILKIVTESGSTDQTWLTELMLKDDLDFFGNLMNVFDICEESKNVDDLHMMFHIVKGIISLNSRQILEKILGDGLIMKIIGCLEYDPDVPQRQHHRNYLKEHVTFKEAIPIKDPLVLSKMHQTSRIGYLMNVILSRGLNDTTAQNLTSIIIANRATIATLLCDSTFFQELFTSLRLPSTSAESRNNLVLAVYS